MTITYPRSLPTVGGVRSLGFRLERLEAAALFNGGAVQVQEYGEPRWRARFVTSNLRRAAWQTWDAWGASLGVGRTFLASDLERPFPVSYSTGFGGLTRYGGGAFDGTATVDALTATSITLSTLPAALALKAGDYVGLVEGGNYALHMAVEDATASASGVVTLAVEPHVLTSVYSVSAVGNLAAPAAKMMIEPGSWSASDRQWRPQPVSFAGIQVVL